MTTIGRFLPSNPIEPQAGWIKTKGDKMIKFVVRCKAKDLIKTITFAWYGIGKEWELDQTDKDLIGLN